MLHCCILGCKSNFKSMEKMYHLHQLQYKNYALLRKE